MWKLVTVSLNWFFTSLLSFCFRRDNNQVCKKDCEFTCRITRIAEGYETVHWSTGVDQVFLHRGFSFIFPC